MKAHVFYKGDWIPVDTVEILDVEEGVNGEDNVTFRLPNTDDAYNSKVVMQ